MPKFSVLTPVHVWSDERRDQLFRAIESLKNQTYQDFEMILVNDGSTLPVEFPNTDKIRLFNQPHLERVNAYRLAMAEAKGDWFACLDSDDEFEPNYLERFAYMIKHHRGFEMYNCGSKYVHKDGKITERGPFTPKMLQSGHEEFGGGNIANGTFIWSNLVYRRSGGFPDGIVRNVDCTSLNYGGVRDLAMSSPWDFSAYAQLEFPELQPQFFVDRENEPLKAIKELGNPWGQDFYLFYKYTRKWQCLPFDEKLYIVNLR